MIITSGRAPSGTFQATEAHTWRGRQSSTGPATPIPVGTEPLISRRRPRGDLAPITIRSRMRGDSITACIGTDPAGWPIRGPGAGAATIRTSPGARLRGGGRGDLYTHTRSAANAR